MSNNSTDEPTRDRLAIHTITTKAWPLEVALERYAAAGIGGVSIWVEAIEGMSATAASRAVQASGLQVPALVRGGFFCDSDSRVREQRIDHNRTLIETAAELSAEMLVLVVGATPGESLDRQRGWVQDGIEALIDDAKAANVRLAIEPLHPMYAADKSCINRLTEAREICESIRQPILGIAVDVYHVWWDPNLQREIQLIGANEALFAFHLCDWRVPTRDLLNDRALMGDGCIDIKGFRHMMDAAGFAGWNEVEIFSDEHWSRDQQTFLDEIIDRYARC
ncbi:sugar phosphate isomerase/epimerase family protein [Allorhodopirellula heiligendammensis]|uniref:Xylose isomerase-like TIM barrel n=1 Tax=Allorhodopirellula heiligendammensis TaxID=2714739 RepID=A0A5C6BH77_9BACT|nr:sugar phosphate isomerase/epimerase family protein [Allorhodopirellula heiligendammensis]TWU09814.1 Xylose isomerase-like TIM barrel [Allorhodopirellula heiligendammensis]